MDEKVKDKISAEDKEVITKGSEETLKWLESNQDASAEEMDAKKKALEEKFQPIMMKVYQQGGGMPGGMEGGMPGGMPGGGMPG